MHAPTGPSTSAKSSVDLIDGFDQLCDEVRDKAGEMRDRISEIGQLLIWKIMAWHFTRMERPLAVMIAMTVNRVAFN